MARSMRRADVILNSMISYKSWRAGRRTQPPWTRWRGRPTCRGRTRSCPGKVEGQRFESQLLRNIQAKKNTRYLPFFFFPQKFGLVRDKSLLIGLVPSRLLLQVPKFFDEYVSVFSRNMKFVQWVYWARIDSKMAFSFAKKRMLTIQILFFFI